MSESGFISFRKEDLQSDEGVAQLNRILNLLAINLPGDSENVKIYSGYGSPEGVITAGIGSIYMRVDGSSDTSVYRKESGTGNTGWIAVSNVVLPLAVASGGTAQDFSGVAQGSLIYFSSTGVMTTLPPGTSGQFLKTLGTSANPLWATFVGNTAYCFSATLAGDTPINDADVTLTEEFDTGGNFSTNTFTAPVTGKYLFTAQVENTPAITTSSSYALMLYKNAAEAVRLDFAFTASTNAHVLSGSAILSLAAADAVTLHFKRISGPANGTITGASNFKFTGCYLT